MYRWVIYMWLLLYYKVESLIKCTKGVYSIDRNVYQNNGKVTTEAIQVKDKIISEGTLLLLQLF